MCRYAAFDTDVVLTGCSTSRNATSSLLLLLSPVIRSRIFDYVFGRKVVHIVGGGDEDEWPRRYKLKICNCPEGDNHLPPRFDLHVLPSSTTAQTDPFCMKTHVQNCTRTAGRREFALDVLLVSRQIYQETVLRPFRQTTFSQMTHGPTRFHGLPAFLCDLAPAQAQAITRMRMVSLGLYFQTQDTIQQLKGLQHLDLLIVPWALDDDGHDFMRILHEFADQYGIRALCRSGLHTVRLAAEINVESDAAVSEISQRVAAGARTVLQWLHDMEVYLLRPNVDIPTIVKMLNSDEREFHALLASRDTELDNILGDTRRWSAIRGFL
jgi:hypothetical protein